METIIGTIELKGKVRVTDPCYETDVWCSGEIDVLPGTYMASIAKKNCGSWGNRVQSLIIRHIGYVDSEFNEEAPFEVGVDSGQAGFFDAAYYAENNDDEVWYKRVCDITLTVDAGCLDNRGAVSSSGYGDGGYYCLLAKNKDGKIVGARIDFMD